MPLGLCQILFKISSVLSHFMSKEITCNMLAVTYFRTEILLPYTNFKISRNFSLFGLSQSPSLAGAVSKSEVTSFPPQVAGIAAMPVGQYRQINCCFSTSSDKESERLGHALSLLSAHCNVIHFRPRGSVRKKVMCIV